MILVQPPTDMVLRRTGTRMPGDRRRGRQVGGWGWWRSAGPLLGQWGLSGSCSVAGVNETKWKERGHLWERNRVTDTIHSAPLSAYKRKPPPDFFWIRGRKRFRSHTPCTVNLKNASYQKCWKRKKLSQEAAWNGHDGTSKRGVASWCLSWVCGCVSQLKTK